MEAVTAAAGRRLKLGTVLRNNGCGGKSGCGQDAPRWWAEGRLGRLAEYCTTDVATLAELVTRTAVRVGGTTVAFKEVTQALRHKTGHAHERKRERPEGAGEEPERARRQRVERTYDETKRRGTKRKHAHGYLERGRSVGGAKRNAIVISSAVVERVVRGRYEWRDGSLRARQHE